MKILTAIIIWIGVLLFDGVLLPATSNILIGMGSIVFLVALVVSQGLHRWVVSLGVALALTTEIIFGLYLGTLVGAWLVALWVWYGINRFLSLKSVVEDSSLVTLLPSLISGLLVLFAMLFAQWGLVRIFYESSISLSVFSNLLTSPRIIIIVAVELLIVIALFGLARNTKKEHAYL
ncbi:MAG: hypothetical protein AAB638_03835 [Patescibacteria group bacterium]